MPKNYDLFLKGGVGGWDFNSDYVNWVLDKNKDSKVTVLVNSLGGYTHEGVAISSLFKIHGNVHVHFVGHNASAATIAAMGAKHVTIDEDGAFLVHKCLYPVMEWAYMNADELDDHIKKLEAAKKDNETIDSCVAGMYARRCKKPKEDLLALMKVGGWLSPEEALEWGFVDEITHFEEDEKPEITESTLSALSAAGIPLPPMQVKKGSFLERLINLFSSKPADKVHEPGSAHSSNSMPNTFSKLAAMLGVSLAVANGAVTLSLEQANMLESKLADHDNTVADLNQKITEKDAKISELEGKIQDLSKEPAAGTSEVTEKTDAEVDPDRVAAALLKMIP